MTHRENTVPVLQGVLVVWLWELLLGGVSMFGLEVRPGFPAYLCMLAIAIPAMSGEVRWKRTWLFVSAVALADLPAMATRGTPTADPVRDLLLGAGLAVILLFPLAFVSRRRGEPGAPTRPGAWLVWLAALASVVGLQAMNRVMRAAGIPNEDRSLMFGDVEIHHINQGVVLLAACVLLAGFPGRRRVLRGALFLATGGAAGLIIDEWLYYALAVLSDDAYFAPVTWVSAAVLLCLLPGMWRIASSLHARCPRGE
jgi:hypothetical protein